MLLAVKISSGQKSFFRYVLFAQQKVEWTWRVVGYLAKSLNGLHRCCNPFEREYRVWYKVFFNEKKKQCKYKRNTQDILCISSKHRYYYFYWEDWWPVLILGWVSSTNLNIPEVSKPREELKGRWVNLFLSYFHFPFIGQR